MMCVVICLRCCWGLAVHRWGLMPPTRRQDGYSLVSCRRSCLVASLPSLALLLGTAAPLFLLVRTCFCIPGMCTSGDYTSWFQLQPELFGFKLLRLIQRELVNVIRQGCSSWPYIRKNVMIAFFCILVYSSELKMCFFGNFDPNFGRKKTKTKTKRGQRHVLRIICTVANSFSNASWIRAQKLSSVYFGGMLLCGTSSYAVQLHDCRQHMIR